MSAQPMRGRKQGTLFPARTIERTVALSVVPAPPQDAPDLAALLAQALPPGWPAADIAASCGDANRAVLKAVNGSVLLGFAILQFAADEAEILCIAVAEEARRNGVGASIMKAAIGACEDKLISSVYLEVAEGNRCALSLYGNFGFRIVARRENYYRTARPAPETALIMRLDIARGAAQINRQAGITL